jgi:RNA polymerase sigma factor (sigma-70 family)
MNKLSFPVSDIDLINAICGTVTDRHEALRYLFDDDNLFHKVRNYVSTQGGTVEDGEDVFQESVILFDRNIRQNRFKGASSLHTYFFAIAKWFWITERRKRKIFVELDASLVESLDEAIDYQLIESENREILRGVLAQIGEKCKELLLLTGIASHTEIAEIRGYSDAVAAKKEVYRCRKKLRDLIEEQPELNSILKSIIK